MSKEKKGWQEIRAEVFRRIQSRQWPPGELIPHETELSAEFGCARATVNRALQSLAKEGWIDRRRRSGTRVARHPVRTAKLEIPILRHEIENLGFQYGYQLVSERSVSPPLAVRKRINISRSEAMIHLVAIHFADNRPYVLEDRWINPLVFHDQQSVDFTGQSANEWLVENIPVGVGEITLLAAPATPRQAGWLRCRPRDSLFVIERNTWDQEKLITYVQLLFPPGYRMTTEL